MTGFGGWDGRDPRLRWLRTWAIAVISVLLVWLIVFEDGPNDLGAIGTLTGALLVLLGYEAGVRLPPRGGGNGD